MDENNPDLSPVPGKTMFELRVETWTESLVESKGLPGQCWYVEKSYQGYVTDPKNVSLRIILRLREYINHHY